MRDLYLEAIRLRMNQSKRFEIDKRVIMDTNILLNDDINKNLVDNISVEKKILKLLSYQHATRNKLVSILEQCIEDYENEHYFSFLFKWKKINFLLNKLIRNDERLIKHMNKIKFE